MSILSIIKFCAGYRHNSPACICCIKTSGTAVGAHTSGTGTKIVIQILRAQVSVITFVYLYTKNNTNLSSGISSLLLQCMMMDLTE